MALNCKASIESFDQYVVLLRNTVTQMVYKHAISTIVPGRPVNFSMTEADDSASAEPLICWDAWVPELAQAGSYMQPHPYHLPLCLHPPQCILVGVDLGFSHFDGELQELGLLAQTAGMQPVADLMCKRKAPDPALFIGSGKAEELKLLVDMHGAQEVLFDQALSPAQQRNLERLLQLPGQ